MKKCPYCGEEIQEEAIECAHCGKDLSVSPEWKAWAKEYARKDPATREKALRTLTAAQRAQFDRAWEALGPELERPQGDAVTEDLRSERRHRRFGHTFTAFFKKHGDAVPYKGKAANISAGGMFLASASSQPVGTRLEIRIDEPEHGFVIEGEVVHSIESGMGIRFVSINELVAKLLLPRAEEKDDRGETETYAAELGIFQMSIASRAEFDAVYNSVLETGGVLVPTSHPATLGTEIKLEVSLTYEPELEPMRLAGRVVRLFQGEMGVMGVEITNLQSSIPDFQRVRSVA